MIATPASIVWECACSTQWEAWVCPALPEEKHHLSAHVRGTLTPPGAPPPPSPPLRCTTCTSQTCRRTTCHQILYCSRNRSCLTERPRWALCGEVLPAGDRASGSPQGAYPTRQAHTSAHAALYGASPKCGNRSLPCPPLPYRPRSPWRRPTPPPVLPHPSGSSGRRRARSWFRITRCRWRPLASSPPRKARCSCWTCC